MSEKIFSEHFSMIKSSDILSSIEQKGFYFYEKALSDEFLEALEQEIEPHRFNINENKPSGVYSTGQYYFINLLLISQSFYDYLTSDVVRDICLRYFGNNFRLKALRYYETGGRFRMQWHTDNKTDRSFAEIPGLIFIFYVSDVEDGEFQYIEGSQNWTGQKSYNNFEEDYINDNHSDKIRSFKAPRGSLLIYNTYGVHRAKPSQDSLMTRKSVFFQVDKELTDSEPILLNTSLHKNQSDWVEQFLGFGLAQKYKVFPTTNYRMVPPKVKVSFILRFILSCSKDLVKFLMRK
jgi:hypothetical protein